MHFPRKGLLVAGEDAALGPQEVPRSKARGISSGVEVGQAKQGSTLSRALTHRYSRGEGVVRGLPILAAVGATEGSPPCPTPQTHRSGEATSCNWPSNKGKSNQSYLGAKR